MFKMIGRLAHISFDLVLISGFLAGVIENKDVQYYATKYLNLGESVFDNTAAFLGNSQYFTRK